MPALLVVLPLRISASLHLDIKIGGIQTVFMNFQPQRTQRTQRNTLFFVLSVFFVVDRLFEKGILSDFSNAL